MEPTRASTARFDVHDSIFLLIDDVQELILMLMYDPWGRECRVLLQGLDSLLKKLAHVVVFFNFTVRQLWVMLPPPCHVAFQYL